MAVATVVDIAVNPSNAAQRYVLWGNGRIDNYGGALPITSGPQWYDRIDQPVGQAIWISNWATGAGYVLDAWGGFQPLNGAAVITTASGDTYVNNNGLPYSGTRLYHGWSWDPAGTGQGYAIDVYGQLYAFGGATPPPRTGPRWSTPSVKGFAMRWTPDKRAYTVDMSGALWLDFAAVVPSPLPPYFAGVDTVRDVAITNWTTGAGYVLTADGATHAFGGASSPLYAGPYRAGADVARTIYILSAADPVKFWQVWSGGQSFDYFASTPPTVVAGGGVNEQQNVAITGSPTGGTFTLTYSGQTTAAIARNAAASAVQTALENLSNIGVGDVVVGGIAPTWTVTFTGAFAVTDVAQMTATSSLTGGTTPAVTVSTVTAGGGASPATTVTTTTRPVLAWTYTDPQNDSQAAWELYVFTQAFVTANSVTDPALFASSAVVAASGVNRQTRGLETPVDLANGTYRFYVRAKDTAGQWSAWSNRGWTQSITPPTAPTGLTATANNTTYSVALSATTGGTAPLVKFEYSDDAGVTWLTVRGAGAVTRIATTTATDYDPPLGLARQYRATAYSTSPRTASTASSTATATVTATGYVLRSTANSALGGEVGVQAPSEWTRPAAAGIFQGLGAKYATVVSDGVPKSRRSTLHIVCETKADWLKVNTLVESDSTLVYRDPFGEVMYCRMAGDWSRAQVAAAPLLTESTPLRHFHVTDLPLVEVAPPVTAT